MCRLRKDKEFICYMMLKNSSNLTASHFCVRLHQLNLLWLVTVLMVILNQLILKFI